MKRALLTMALVMVATGAVAQSRTKHPNPFDRFDEPWDKAGYKAWTIELQMTKGTGVSCASAMKYTDEQVNKWVEGFWTGLNVATGSMVGHTTDNAGMMAEIKLDCDKTPSDKFLQSVHRTWIRLRAADK